MNRPSKMGHLPHAHDVARAENPRFMRRLIAGWAATVMVSGGFGLASLGLAGVAQANPPAAVNIRPVGAQGNLCPLGAM
jgi:hypothetical protein